MLGWFARLPFGIGFGTLRACLRLAMGLQRSGTASAGNGAAMRAAIVGVALANDADRRARLIAHLHDGPFGPRHLRALAHALDDSDTRRAPPYSAVAALLRNLLLFPVVIAHGLRRLIPF